MLASRLQRFIRTITVRSLYDITKKSTTPNVPVYSIDHYQHLTDHNMKLRGGP